MSWGFAVLLVVTLAGWAVTVALAIREIDRLRRTLERSQTAQTAERRELLDRIMYLSGHPWSLPPEPPAEPEPDPYVVEAMDEPLPMIVDYDEIEPAARV